MDKSNGFRAGRDFTMFHASFSICAPELMSFYGENLLENVQNTVSDGVVRYSLLLHPRQWLVMILDDGKAELVFHGCTEGGVVHSISRIYV